MKSICAMCSRLDELLPNGIGTHEWSEINGHRACTSYKRGQIIFYEGNWPKALYYVVSGKIKLYRDTYMGKKYILYIAGVGDFMGQRSLLSEEKYAASAMALEDTKVCSIPKATFHMLLQENPVFMKEIAKSICRKMGVMEGKISAFAYSSVLERLSATLLMLWEAYGNKEKNGKGGVIDIVLLREDLASIIGTATETVIRLLSNLKLEGIISFRGKKIYIEDSCRLTRQAGKTLADII